MCGPLALALPTPHAGGLGYLAGRLAYNLGRVSTYALLGLAFGAVGKSLLLVGLQQWVSLGLGLLLLAGLLFSPHFYAAAPVVRLVGLLKRVMGAHIRRRTIRSPAILGLLNGLLPCGLVYVACAGAAATGGTFSGAAYMIIFGLGTVPMMLAISLSGGLVRAAVRGWITRAVPVSVGLLAVLLILRGMGLGIPYLSPDLSSGPAAGSCCPSVGEP
jgi:sulfite exporter TauE/SafE